MVVPRLLHLSDCDGFLSQVAVAHLAPARHLLTACPYTTLSWLNPIRVITNLLTTDNGAVCSLLALQRMRNDLKWLVLGLDWFSRVEHLGQSGRSRDEFNFSGTARANEAEILRRSSNRLDGGSILIGCTEDFPLSLYANVGILPLNSPSLSSACYRYQVQIDRMGSKTWWKMRVCSPVASASWEEDTTYFPGAPLDQVEGRGLHDRVTRTWNGRNPAEGKKETCPRIVEARQV
uniref:Uncharacterized protein n=1 Tax=Timema cristinae TaxID=61476 RepID=A0A7R9GUR6_TIMCR|nr:unnamed protein product [Timema cristinae]